MDMRSKLIQMVNCIVFHKYHPQPSNSLESLNVLYRAIIITYSLGEYIWTNIGVWNVKIFFLVASFKINFIIAWLSAGTCGGTAGSIPDCVIGIFRWHNPSGPTMTPGVDSASDGNEYQKHLNMSHPEVFELILKSRSVKPQQFINFTT